MYVSTESGFVVLAVDHDDGGGGAYQISWSRMVRLPEGTSGSWTNRKV
jgi:hypothetical protein